MNRTTWRMLTLVFLIGSLTACSHKLGSPEWCADMKEKPKGEWSMNEMKDVAKYCVLGASPDE